MPVSKEEAIEEATSMIKLVMEESIKRIENVLNSGLVDLEKDAHHILIGKIVAKAAINEGLHQWLTLSKQADRKVNKINNSI